MGPRKDDQHLATGAGTGWVPSVAAWAKAAAPEAGGNVSQSARSRMAAMRAANLAAIGRVSAKCFGR